MEQLLAEAMRSLRAAKNLLEVDSKWEDLESNINEALDYTTFALESAEEITNHGEN